jgi:NodT family efflux transporter outer membrane factor (OMF) lipoprotein
MANVADGFQRTLWKWMLVSMVSWAVSGCKVGPDYHRPSAPIPVTYKEMKGWTPATPANGLDRSDWWTIYHDPTLNALEEQVRLSNQNIKQFEAEYQQARAEVREQQSSLYPSAVVTPTVEHLKSGSVASTTTYTPAGNVTWDLDVWGKIRRNIESSVANAQASAAELADAQLSAQAEVATDYFQLRYQDSLQQLLNETVQAFERSLEIVRNQYAAGTAARSDVVTAQTQLLSTRALAVNVGVQRATYEHALALLTGRPPAELTLRPKLLDARVPTIPLALPSTLLQRRPDIAAAERQMQQENALIGVNVAAFYPAISLSAALSSTGSALGALFAASNQLWYLAASASETVFEGGQRTAAVAAARAGYESSVANYRQTVLTAFQGVEDDLSTLRILSQQAAVENSAVEAAQRAVDITLNEYKAGTVAYTTVITAQTALLADQQSALAIQANRVTASVALIKALGGGWDTSRLPLRDQGHDRKL